MAPTSFLTGQLVAAFKQIVGEQYVLADEETLFNYSHDETEDLHYLPEVVLKPATAEEISAILKICNKEKIPVTPRGAGTGLSGGALPHLGSVLLSTERMNRIIHIDERNLQVTTEPGVITEVLQNAVKEKHLFYPPDPSSRGSCFIGGNVAENSGGPKAVKYGVVKDYVLNLEMVLPTGEIIWTGANVLKNATGYNLTQLVVGSEGTLGVVTKIVLRLVPLPRHDLLMLVPFDAAENACAAVSAIFRATIWNETVPDRMRGRLAGMEMLSYTSGPTLGNVEAGFAAALIGLRGSIVVGGVLCVAGSLALAAALPGLWRYESEAMKHRCRR